MFFVFPPLGPGCGRCGNRPPRPWGPPPPKKPWGPPPPDSWRPPPPPPPGPPRPY